jgi:hypothetical protein
MMEDEEKNNLFEELNKYSEQFGELKEGDLTSNEIRNRKKCSRNAALNWMRRMVEKHPEMCEMVQVSRDISEGGGVWQWVIRKKNLEHSVDE